MEIKLLAVYYMLPVSNLISFIVGIICLSWHVCFYSLASVVQIMVFVLYSVYIITI